MDVRYGRTPAEIVEDGVAAFQDLDDAIAAAIEAAERVQAVVASGVAAGMAPGIQSGLMNARAGMICGHLQAANYAKWDLHKDCTFAAKANDVDTGQLDRVTGIKVMGGGGR